MSHFIIIVVEAFGVGGVASEERAYQWMQRSIVVVFDQRVTEFQANELELDGRILGCGSVCRSVSEN